MNNEDNATGDFQLPADVVELCDLAENIVNKEQLLAIGDRYEESIAANLRQDAAYR